MRHTLMRQIMEQTGIEEVDHHRVVDAQYIARAELNEGQGR